MASPPFPVNYSNLCSHQASNCPALPSASFTQTFFVEQGPLIMFTTTKVHSVSHTRFMRRRATLAPPSRGVLEPRGCCDVVPALTRCGPLQRRPPGLGSERTHRRGSFATESCPEMPSRCCRSASDAGFLQVGTGGHQSAMAV